MIKAAIVFNICKFVSWPPNDGGDDVDLDIALVGQAEDDPTFTELVDKKFKDGTVRVHLCDTLTQASKYDVVYISRSHAQGWEPLRDRLGDEAVLTVSEIDDFTDRGGMVQLVQQQNRLRFRINTDATDRADLQLSSQLLKIAEIVGE